MQFFDDRFQAESGRNCFQFHPDSFPDHFSGKILMDLGRLDGDWKVIIIWMAENLSVQRWTLLNCNTLHDIMTFLAR
jgi:hypothetical protein